MKLVKELENLYWFLFLFQFLYFSYTVINYSELLSVSKLENSVENKLNNMDIVIGGEAVGIKLLATGVLVMSVDRDDLPNILIGDVILK